MSAALTRLCETEALFAYLVCHFNTPDALCQFPRSA